MIGCGSLDIFFDDSEESLIHVEREVNFKSLFCRRLVFILTSLAAEIRFFLSEYTYVEHFQIGRLSFFLPSYTRGVRKSIWNPYPLAPQPAALTL